MGDGSEAKKQKSIFDYGIEVGYASLNYLKNLLDSFVAKCDVPYDFDCDTCKLGN